MIGDHRGEVLDAVEARGQRDLLDGGVIGDGLA